MSSESNSVLAAKRDDIRRLPRKSAVRRIAEEYLAYGPDALHDIGPLVNVLDHPRRRNWRERLVSVWLLGREDLPAEHRMVAITTLYNALTETRYAGDTGGRAWTHTFKLGYATGIGLILMISLVSGGFGNPADWLGLLVALVIGPLFLALPIGMVLAPFVMPPALWADNSVRAMAAESLGRLQYPRTTGALAGAVRDSSAEVRHRAQKALKVVAPLLSQEHYGRAGPNTVANLIGLLRHSSSSLVLIALDGLEMVGGGSALPEVRRLAKKGPQLVRGRAAEVQAVLEERVRQENDPQLLLRAASAPESPDEILLRPAVGAIETDNLLRPTLE